MGGVWPAGKFLIAMPGSPRERVGYVWRGLGLCLLSEGSPKGKRPPKWGLSHLGSGHLVGTLIGDVRTAFPVATEIAEAGDWTFDGLGGWQNQFPDVVERLKEIIARHPKVFSIAGGGAGQNPDAAMAVTMARS